MSLLAAIEAHPMAGMLVAVILLLVNSIIAKWRGSTNATTTERESLKLAKQTSETVNHCSTRSHKVMDKFEEHMDANDIGHLSTEISNAIQMLEKMDARESILELSLAGVTRICDSIADDLRRGDHRIVHTGIINQLGDTLHEIEEVKRIILENAKIVIDISRSIK